MSKWKLPPAIKIYEALGAIGDQRIITEGETAIVYSSDGSKKYDVVFSEAENAIIANDNGSYWVGYLGYPSIAYLMLTGKINLRKDYADALKDIEWKKINEENKNDFQETQKQVDKIIEDMGIDLDQFYLYLAEVNGQIALLDLDTLGPRQKPPASG